MNKTLDSWIRIGDDKYEGSLVGNRKGFESLKSAIEEMFERGEDSVSIDADTDFGTLILVEEPKVDEKHRPWQLKLAGWVLAPFLVAWLFVLPVYGLYSLYEFLCR